MNTGNATPTSDEIRRRIATLKEELDKKKARLKRSLEKKQPETTPKRVRFSDAETPPGLESYILSQNLFDDAEETDKPSRDGAIVVPCSFLPTRCSVLSDEGRTLVSLLCDDAVCVSRAGDVSATVFSRRSRSSRFLLADVCRTAGGEGLLLCELQGRHLVASWLSLSVDGSIRAAFPAAVQDWPQESAPRTALVWNPASNAALLLTSSSTAARVTALAWNDTELAASASRPAECSFGDAFFVTSKHALVVIRSRSELGLVSLRDCVVRRIDRADAAPLLRCAAVGKERDAVFLAGLDGGRQTTAFLDCLNTRTWRFLRLRRVTVDLEAPEQFYACRLDTMLCLDGRAIRRLCVDWRRQSVEESTHRLPTDVQWIFGCSSFLAWCSRGIVAILQIPP